MLAGGRKGSLREFTSANAHANNGGKTSSLLIAINRFPLPSIDLMHTKSTSACTRYIEILSVTPLLSVGLEYRTDSAPSPFYSLMSPHSSVPFKKYINRQYSFLARSLVCIAHNFELSCLFVYGSPGFATEFTCSSRLTVRTGILRSHSNLESQRCGKTCF